MISVYISNEKIIILNGEAKFGIFHIYECYKAKTPERAILNGVITDVAALRHEIGELWKTYKLPNKGVKLVIDNAPVIGKVMRVPYLDQSKIYKLVTRELQSSESEETIYDYAILSEILEKQSKKDRKQVGIDIYACAAPKALVENYVSIFEANDIKLSGINLSVNCVIKLGHYLRSLAQKTYIIIALDGNSVASFLFINGKYAISNKYRLAYERGTIQSSMEIGQIVSSLIQFNASQRNEHNVTDVFLCGTYNDEEDIGQYITQGLGIRAGKLPQYPAEFFISDEKAGDYELSNCIYASGNLI